MELPCRILEQIAFNTRSKIEEHMLIVMEKSTHKQLFFQSPQTNNKQFKLTITFLKGYNGIFNVTISNKKFFFAKSVTDKDGFIQSTIPKGAYEIESLIDEIKRIVFDEGHFTEANCAFKTKLNFSTVGSIMEISKQEPIINFLTDDSIWGF